MKKCVTTCVTLLLLSFVVSVPAFAQVINATVPGTVADASGALIPGAEATATTNSTGTTDTRITNESGSFAFPSLQPGPNYTIAATLSGFQTAVDNNVVLGQSQTVRLNFTLQVGAAAQNVEVT